jgi:hypothetical protein
VNKPILAQVDPNGMTALAVSRLVVIAPLLVVAITAATNSRAVGATESTPFQQATTSAPFATSHSSVPHPRHNIAPHPDYVDACIDNGYDSKKCIHLAVAAIRHARSHEHMKKRAMILPRNYAKLSVADQTFVITDLERVDRGLKPFAGMSTALNGVAKTAANLHIDPSLATALLKALHVDSYGSNWAADFGPLGSDYDWMYNDGYSSDGINLACTRRAAPLCWGHRSNILWDFGSDSRLVAGAATAKPAGSSIALVLAATSGKVPKYSYTWKNALHHGANGHGVKDRP